MKLRIQAQHLQPGDIVGSGAYVTKVIINSINWPSNKVKVGLTDALTLHDRNVLWGKYTMISVERME